MNLMPHQQTALRSLLKILGRFNVAYLAGELRTGKTITALMTAKEFLLKKLRVNLHQGVVLFVTSKKAMQSIQSDYDNSALPYRLVIINYESVHKIEFSFRPDFLILDEAHRLGAYPKPTKQAVTLRTRLGNLPTILMSGTPSPESYSQLYHQLWVTMQGCWKEFRNFYKWAYTYVKVEKEFIGMGRFRNDYSGALPQVMEQFKPLCVTMTQAQAGFDGDIIETIHDVTLPPYLATMLRDLKRKKVFEDAWITLEADSGARLSSMIHQLSSGTIISNEGKAYSIDDFKARYIKETFRGRKIAIFYFYQEEGRMLKKVFPAWTDNPAQFNSSKHLRFICQVRSGREGVNLSSADDIIFFNISYSAVSYWQARARSQSFKGGNKQVNWLFSVGGVERAIYEIVKGKKDFTLKHFESYVRNTVSKEGGSSTEKSRLGNNPPAGNGPRRLARLVSFKGTGKNVVAGNKKAGRKRKGE